MGEPALILVADGEQRSADQLLRGVGEDTGEVMVLDMRGGEGGGFDDLPLQLQDTGAAEKSQTVQEGVRSDATNAAIVKFYKTALDQAKRGRIDIAALGAAYEGMGRDLPIVGQYLEAQEWLFGQADKAGIGRGVRTLYHSTETGARVSAALSAQAAVLAASDYGAASSSTLAAASALGAAAGPIGVGVGLAVGVLSSLFGPDDPAKAAERAKALALARTTAKAALAGLDKWPAATRELFLRTPAGKSLVTMASYVNDPLSLLGDPMIREQLRQAIYAKTGVVVDDASLVSETKKRLDAARRAAMVQGMHVAPRVSGEGMAPAQQMPASERPEPVYHLASAEMPRRVFEGLIRLVPAMRSLPREQLQAVAGKRGASQDVSGVDPVDQSYIAEPGETPRDIARRLVSDERRAGELTAANPGHRRDDPRWYIPPGWFQFSSPFVVAVLDDTGSAVSGEDDDLPFPGIPLPVPKAPEPLPLAPDEPLPIEAPQQVIAVPKPKPASGAAPSGGGGRPTLTKRVVKVLASDWPEKIAKRIGAAPSPTWWRELKQANPHKATKDDGGNWVSLSGGELLNVPDSWPLSSFAIPAPGVLPSVPGAPPAPIPPPGVLPDIPNVPGLNQIPSVPGLPGGLPSVPAVLGGATTDPGVIGRAQVELAAWTRLHPEAADPRDFGQAVATMQVPFSADLSGVVSERTTRATKAFQTWRNAQGGQSPALRTDGALDAPTVAALDAWAAAEAAGAKVPGGLPTIPGQLPGGGSIPLPSKPAQSSNDSSGGAALALVTLLAGAFGGLF